MEVRLYFYIVRTDCKVMLLPSVVPIVTLDKCGILEVVELKFPKKIENKYLIKGKNYWVCF